MKTILQHMIVHAQLYIAALHYWRITLFGFSISALWCIVHIVPFLMYLDDQQNLLDRILVLFNFLAPLPHSM